MFRERFGARLATVALATCLALGTVVTSGSSPAGAVGTIHRLSTSVRSSGNAVEGSARVSFSCNDVTLAYKLKLTNVQVIEADGFTSWADYDVVFLLWYPLFRSASLVQNTTNGLFGSTQTGVLDLAKECETGTRFIMTNDSGALQFVGELT
jgi:hypothetical protein